MQILLEQHKLIEELGPPLISVGRVESTGLREYSKNWPSNRKVPVENSVCVGFLEMVIVWHGKLFEENQLFMIASRCRCMTLRKVSFQKPEKLHHRHFYVLTTSI